MTALVKPDDLSLIRAMWWERTDSHQLQETSSVRVGRGTRSCISLQKVPRHKQVLERWEDSPWQKLTTLGKKVLEMMMFGDHLMR